MGKLICFFCRKEIETKAQMKWHKKCRHQMLNSA